MKRVMLVEDNPGDAQLTSTFLEQSDFGPFEVDCFNRLQPCLDALADRAAPDLLLLDLGLPDSAGLGSLQALNEIAPQVPVIVLTSEDSIELGAAAVAQGAQDYFCKNDINSVVLPRVILNAIERHRLRRDLERLHHQVAQSEANFRKLINENADAILVIDNSGVICFVNPAAQDLFQLPIEELIGAPFGFPIVDGTAELDLNLPNHRRTVAAMRVVGTVWEGEPAFLASMRDITPYKLLQKKLETSIQAHEVRNRELSHARKEIEFLLHSASHDLRAPLVNFEGGVSKFTQCLHDLEACLKESPPPPEALIKAKEILRENAAGTLALLHRGTRKLGGMIDALLQMSRTGQLELDCQPLNMTALAREAAEEYAGAIDQRGIDLAIQDMPWAFGDPIAVRRLFCNLLGNAVKYLDPQRTGRIEVGCAGNDQGMHQYFVRDNGIGMEPHCIDKIFRLFHRLKQNDAPGDGVGLAIVKRLVERHDGEVTVLSVPDQGTTFTFSLPAAPLDDTSPSSLAPHPASAS